MNQEIFFRLLNFIILLALGIYFFKKKIFPHFKKNMRKRSRHTEDLRQEITSLKKTQQHVKKDQTRQMEHCDEWKEKIRIWRNSWNASRDIMRQTMVKNQQDLSAKRKRQTYNFEAYQQFESVKPGVISKTSETLKEMYESDEARKEYTEKIIAMLK